MADRSIIKIPKPPDLEELLLSLDTECDSEELGTKPAWFEVAEKRASESGQTVDELLIADRKRLRESNYPGPECFEPHELELYVNGKLSSERIAHTKNCPSCTGLLRVALPSDALLGKLVGEIQKLAQVLNLRQALIRQVRRIRRTYRIGIACNHDPYSSTKNYTKLAPLYKVEENRANIGCNDAMLYISKRPPNEFSFDQFGRADVAHLK